MRNRWPFFAANGALQHIYGQPKLRDEILDLISDDVNQDARDDVGREGMDYWQILVLAAVRLGCNLDYDKLQDLAEQHRSLRHIMGLGDWSEEANFGWRRIRDNVCLLKPTTIEKISHLIVAEGHRLQPEAAKQTRADSFVAETNIHWPAESTLIRDGVRKIIEMCVLIASTMKSGGWRQTRLNDAIEEASFDRGFHTPENQRQLAEIIPTCCLPKPGSKQSKEQEQGATIAFRQAHQRHAGVESAIGALQAGNGLERSRDRTELGFERYVALGILGRNFHVLGKLIIAREVDSCEAARSKRKELAA